MIVERLKEPDTRVLVVFARNSSAEHFCSNASIPKARMMFERHDRNSTIRVATIASWRDVDRLRGLMFTHVFYEQYVDNFAMDFLRASIRSHTYNGEMGMYEVDAHVAMFEEAYEIRDFIRGP